MAVNGVSVLAWDGPTTPAQDVRLGLAALLRNGTTRNVGTRNGSRPGSAPTTVSGTTGTIPPRSVVIDPQGTNTQGPYLVAWRSAQTVTFDPAPSSNSRIDVVYARLFDSVFDTSGQQVVTFGVVSGTAASNPTAPTTLSDGTPLSKVCVLDYVTVPSTGAATVVPGPVVVAAGGVVSGLSTDRGVLYDGQVVSDVDTRTARVNWVNGGLDRLLTDRNTFIQSDSTVRTTDAVGGFGISFPTPFAAAPLIVASSGDLRYATTIALNVNSLGADAFFGNAGTTAGPVVSGAVRINWIAIGTRP